MSTQKIRIWHATIGDLRIDVAGDLIVTREPGSSSWEASLLTHESLANLGGTDGPFDIVLEGEKDLRGRGSVSVEIRTGIGGSMTRIQAKGTGELEPL